MDRLALTSAQNWIGHPPVMQLHERSTVTLCVHLAASARRQWLASICQWHCHRRGGIVWLDQDPAERR